VVIVVAEATGSESILDYKGLAKRHPVAAITFAIFLFSLTGIPPFAGFAGKWYLFVALFERIPGPGGGWYAVLALIGALNTAVSLYYYVRIVRAMFIDPAYAEHPAPFKARVGYQLMLGGFSAAVLLLGVWWTPFVRWSEASLQMFRG
jgi:NADH-quinone oxidoreductase subunit N